MVHGETVLFWTSLVFMSGYVILLLVFMVGWMKLKIPVPGGKGRGTFISVLVVARNEESTILSFLQSMLIQDYPKDCFEIILTNDTSGDTTKEKIKNFIAENPAVNIKLVEAGRPEKYFSPKKQHITRAVSLARGELIVTTDADCIAPKPWLSAMAGFYEKENPAMIIGPVAFAKGNSFLEKFQSLEFSGIMLATGATAFLDKPVMCNGANLAFKKEAFILVKGYEGNEHIASGDDVFLMNKVKATFPGRVKFLKSRDAIVLTHPVQRIGPFIQQRLRWASKSTFHAGSGAAGIGTGVFLSCFLLVFFAILSVLNPHFIYHFWVLVVLKCVIDLLYLYLGCRFFSNTRLLWGFPLAIVFQFVYVNMVMMKYIGGSKYSWKGREYSFNSR